MWFSIGHPLLLWPLASACLGRLNGRYHSSTGDAMAPYLTAEKNEYVNHITNGSHRATWAKRLYPPAFASASPERQKDSHCTCPWSGVWWFSPPFPHPRSDTNPVRDGAPEPLIHGPPHHGSQALQTDHFLDKFHAQSRVSACRSMENMRLRAPE
ncbi:hypothetical protein LY76DRAFT_271544 [Colletotrichum caudatum]|nr:hypothetical protein LY76DRAFT_271544 [Colletotrichum caudatum]